MRIIPDAKNKPEFKICCAVTSSGVAPSLVFTTHRAVMAPALLPSSVTSRGLNVANLPVPYNWKSVESMAKNSSLS